jgi:hypothetical protein
MPELRPMIGTVLFLLLAILFFAEHFGERARRRPTARNFDDARMFDGDAPRWTPMS